MALGPIEVVVISFPGNRFDGSILPELQRLVDAGTITVVDGLFVLKDGDGAVTFTELDEIGGDEDAARLAALVDRLDDLISDEDVEELAAGLDLDSSAAILIFEHTWVKPLRDAIVGVGGELTANFRIPGLVIEELLAELQAAG
ncbi:MAG: DUF6325 family protein [Actinomycetota bacterium]